LSSREKIVDVDHEKFNDIRRRVCRVRDDE